MLRLTLATVMSLGLVSAAKAGEFDKDVAKPTMAKAAFFAPSIDLNGGSEFDKESPTQAHRWGGWGWGGWRGGWGWGGGWHRGWGWGGWRGGWGWGGGWHRGWGWGGWRGGWGGWGWGGYRSFYSYPVVTSYSYTPVYYSSGGFVPCYYW